MVQKNYLPIKQDVEDIVVAEMDIIMGDPELTGVLINK